MWDSDWQAMENPKCKTLWTLANVTPLQARDHKFVTTVIHPLLLLPGRILGRNKASSDLSSVLQNFLNSPSPDDLNTFSQVCCQQNLISITGQRWVSSIWWMPCWIKEHTCCWFKNRLPVLMQWKGRPTRGHWGSLQATWRLVIYLQCASSWYSLGCMWQQYM